MQKHMLETGDFIVNTVAEEVPHRHIVFTIPKLMRKNFYWHRESLNDLSRMAWKCTLAFMRGTLKRNGRPGAIIGIETSGQFIDLNPHVHEITSDGLFDDNGNFYLMPRCDDRARACLQAMWENEVSKYVIRKQYVNRETVRTNRHPWLVLTRASCATVKSAQLQAHRLLRVPQPSCRLQEVE